MYSHVIAIPNAEAQQLFACISIIVCVHTRLPQYVYQPSSLDQAGEPGGQCGLLSILNRFVNWKGHPIFLRPFSRILRLEKSFKCTTCTFLSMFWPPTLSATSCQPTSCVQCMQQMRQLQNGHAKIMKQHKIDRALTHLHQKASSQEQKSSDQHILSLNLMYDHCKSTFCFGSTSRFNNLLA
jgi:hypothetical protein